MGVVNHDTDDKTFDDVSYSGDHKQDGDRTGCQAIDIGVKKQQISRHHLKNQVVSGIA